MGPRFESWWARHFAITPIETGSTQLTGDSIHLHSIHLSVHHRRRWRAGGLCAGLDQARGVRASLAVDPDPVRAAFIVRRFIRVALTWHGRSNAWSLFVWKQPWHPPWCECGWKCQPERRTDTFRDEHAAIQQGRCNAARLTIGCPKYLGNVTAWKLAAI